MKIRRFLLLCVVVLLALTVPIGGVGWKYKHKKPPGKRPKPKGPATFYIQVDPLRVVKNFNDPDVKVGPNIILAMDTSMRMQYDFDGVYYDQRAWDKEAKFIASQEPNPTAIAATLGVSSAARYYRRMYKNLYRKELNTNPVTSEYYADRIDVVDDQSPDFLSFHDVTRLGMARDGLYQAITENLYITNWGLQDMRHGQNDKLPDQPGNEQPVFLSDQSQTNLNGDILNKKKWKVSYVLPNGRNVDANSEGSDLRVKVIEQKDASSKTAFFMMHPPDDSDQANTLLPAGRDQQNFQDAPIKLLLDDARAAVVKAMDKDDDKFRACRNTAVILVTGGKDGANLDTGAVAATFNAVTVKGVTRRVPIYVIAIGPPQGDVAKLQEIADRSGGEYFESWDANQVAFAANYVAQSVFRRATDFEANLESEWQTVSPIVGTVDLTNGKDINNNPLPNSSISVAGSPLPQLSNVLLTGGFSLPGFEMRLRAFRAYRPEVDVTRPMGYKFVKDGTRLWVAHTVGNPKSSVGSGDNGRNIFTYIPGSGMVAFNQANAQTLKPYLVVPDDDTLGLVIDVVRQQPLGAILDSTPAVMNPPSLDPPPDAAYTSFVQLRENRRSIVFLGANDGMLHAIDGRTGVEVWAFIPYNLLPKLKTLVDGQSVDKFDYFVDSSPKVADVKVNGNWRTYLFVGEGPGGTFYQTFDVSDAGNNVDPTTDTESQVVGAFAGSSIIPFVWSFPDYTFFDHTISNADAQYGDVAGSAPTVAKTVGQTWSDPAIGQITDINGPWTMLVGSGYISPTLQKQSNRGNLVCGTTFYALDVATGNVLDSYDVGDDKNKESLKAALQADPSATGPVDTRYIDTVYIGDTEGALWRFKVSYSGTSVSLSKPPAKLYDANQWNPIYTSLALVNVGGNQQYIFLTTGIDILPWTRTDKIDQFRLVGLLDKGQNGAAQKKFEIKLDKADSKGGDERPTAAPAVAGDVVFFTTTTEYPDKPCEKYESSLFALTYVGGAAYDVNADSKVDNADKVIQQPLGRATSVFVSDQHLYFGTDTNVEIFGDPEDFNNGVLQLGLRMLTWREVR